MRLVLLGDGESPHLLKWARALAPRVELWAASSRGFAPGFDALVPAERRLALATTPDAQGRWVASRFDDGAARPLLKLLRGDTSTSTIRCAVADFTVSGVRVDASAARIEPAGATLAVGGALLWAPLRELLHFALPSGADFGAALAAVTLAVMAGSLLARRVTPRR